VFAKKPAPVQATYLGFHSGTGLTGIDYYIIDEKMAAGVQPFFLEKITHLEYSWNIDESLLPLRSRSLNSPYQRKGHITLGSLNNPIKFNDETIEAWVQIMKKCPTAVLHHRSKIFVDPSVREAFVNRFVKHGVVSDRILCEGALSRDEALAWLSEEVDIGLDPFPYGSHTTGLESIAMGVPMVSFFGERIPSRVCAVFMERLGLQNWVARSHGEYIDITVQLIQQPEKIQEARSHLLKIAKDTQLLDSVSFADSFSKVMNSLWNNYVIQSFKGEK
jgi:predicted O-linked N-acetylglucosamine transferase (SPINDLY family)